MLNLYLCVNADIMVWIVYISIVRENVKQLYIIDCKIVSVKEISANALRTWDRIIINYIVISRTKPISQKFSTFQLLCSVGVDIVT